MFHSSLSSQAGEAVLLSNNISLVIQALPSVSSHQSLHVETVFVVHFLPSSVVLCFSVLQLIDGYRLPVPRELQAFKVKSKNTKHAKLPVLHVLNADST